MNGRQTFNASVVDYVFAERDRLEKENRKLRNENDKLKRNLEILEAHGVTIVDAVSGGFEIYNKDYARANDMESENAKLREHLNELLMIGSFNGSCRRDCRYMDDCLADRFGQPDCFVCQELQELGIKVDK